MELAWKYVLGYAALGLVAGATLVVIVLYLACSHEVYQATQREGRRLIIRLLAVALTPLTLIVWTITLRHTNHKRHR